MKSRLILALFMVLLVAGFAAAQSPTSQSTMELFTSDADDFMSVTSFADVEFDNWFAFGSFASPGSAQLGYARYLGDLYLGFFYEGNLWAGYPTKDITRTEYKVNDKNIDFLMSYPTGLAEKTFKQYTNFPDLGTKANENSFSVLIGVAGMGFKLSYTSSYASFSGKNVVEGSGTSGSYYESYKEGKGTINPSIQWGMTTPLMDQGIRPTVTLDLAFDRDTNVYTQLQMSNYAGTVGWYNRGKYTNNSNSTDTKIGLNLGGFNFYSGDNFTFDLDFDYELGITSYKSTLSVNPWGKTISEDWKYENLTAKTSGFTGGGTGYIQMSDSSHSIKPSVYASYESDRLNLAAGLLLPISISTEKRIPFARKVVPTSYDFVRTSAETRETILSFNPQLLFGLQYQIVPGKFSLNAGAAFVAVDIVSTTNKTFKTYLDGSVVVSDFYIESSTRKTEFSGGSVSALFAGFTFNLTENFSLQAVTGLDGGNDFNIFGTSTGSISYFSQILASVKF